MLGGLNYLTSSRWFEDRDLITHPRRNIARKIHRLSLKCESFVCSEKHHDQHCAASRRRRESIPSLKRIINVTSSSIFYRNFSLVLDGCLHCTIKSSISPFFYLARSLIDHACYPRSLDKVIFYNEACLSIDLLYTHPRPNLQQLRRLLKAPKRSSVHPAAQLINIHVPLYTSG
ncbi:hypothetical protein EJ02DRAFT_27340 [Clathrospora elynae]|uniref:Uncharacterized protein n=1 Tax=Clathrospora elynae TaxID=706981 RepID=A0A6A5SFB6_9PLEO|nr:hypothetical protein EJ02DRAFT_27340 [Clathrospora elynae]